jgi:hypothetical protein
MRLIVQRKTTRYHTNDYYETTTGRQKITAWDFIFVAGASPAARSPIHAGINAGLLG